MLRSTAINTATETGYTKAAMIETVVKSMISIPETTNTLTKGTSGIWASMMISSMGIATDIRSDTTTATTVGRYALTFMDWMSATIRIALPAGTRTPTRTPAGDIPTSPKTRAIETGFRPDDKIWIGTKIFTQISTMPLKMPTTVIRKATATRIATRINIAGDLLADTKTLLTGSSDRWQLISPERDRKGHLGGAAAPSPQTQRTRPKEGRSTF